MIHNILHSDTIAALATPKGRGGISVIKLSGPDSLSVANSVFRSIKSPSEHPRNMVYGHICDGEELIDEALLCFMPAPHSYTGEDVVELQTHGGLAVSDTVLALLTRKGVRPAEPGEFTRRAFLNGRIDLVQAEAVMDVVTAETREQLRQAERMLNGRFSKNLHELIEQMTKADALLTLNIDFSDQDEEEFPRARIQPILSSCLDRIDTLLRSSETGQRLRNGITVVLTGPVNSGKSSLFNALLGRKRALVNARPGTTRDWIEERIDLGGLPVNLIDTAGLRETTDEIEQEGVVESRRLLQEADIVVSLVDPSLPSPCVFTEEHSGTHLAVFSKSDLVPPENRIQPGLYSSTLTGEGLDDLRIALIEAVQHRISISDTTPILMIERHHAHLKKARTHLNAAFSALDRWSEEIVSYELRLAREEIQRITGEIIEIDVLDTVFRSFCIGK